MHLLVIGGFVILIGLGLGKLSSLRSGLNSQIQLQTKEEPLLVKFEEMDYNESFFCDDDKTLIVNINGADWNQIRDPKQTKKLIQTNAQKCIN